MLPVDIILIFIMTTFVVVLSPGPAAIAVTTEAVANGFKSSRWLILGVAVANVIFFILSATGIAALIVASNTLFNVIKWIGVAYLLYLGLKAMFGESGPINFNNTNSVKANVYKVFAKGFSLEIANPKALLYFSALLPQFIDISYPIVPQIAVFCLITFILDISCYSLYAYLGVKSTNLKNNKTATKIINRLSGAMLIFVGLRMASVER